MAKKVLIVSGGTGGHVFPALALAESLKMKRPQIDLVYAGGGLDKNRFFQVQNERMYSVSCATISPKKPFKAILGIAKLFKGLIQSLNILRREKPDAVVAFGSYSTLPLLIAARLMRLPIILHEGNSFPGQVNRYFSPYANVTAVQFPKAAEKLRGNTCVSHLPLRYLTLDGLDSPEKARLHFGLDPDTFTFLVFGGSQGAKAINFLFTNALVDYLSKRSRRYQVLHFTGDSVLTPRVMKLYTQCGIKAHVCDFEDNMDIAWRAADMLVSRAGASTIAEQLQFEVPGILIPYPWAKDKHQDANAAFMSETVGGAIMVQEKELNPEKLSDIICDCVAREKEKLCEMRKAINEYKSQNQQKEFSDLVLENIGEGFR
jgi:UDP-N-acetylglucosamine--N-acetylmuramyl-(pentapeptide) pyrophosphoryl-undecaprenol N-acetylglucosamine transferase